MNICTLTGIDENTSIESLISLGEEFPFVEFGVLFSPNRVGNRYPSPEWIKNLQKELPRHKRKFRFALHLCGQSVNMFVENGILNYHLSYIDFFFFHRYQLNFSGHFSKNPENVKMLVHRIPMYEKTATIITQHNKTNEHLLKDLKGLSNHALLFDKSGGRGVLASEWPKAIEGFNCGYAGGLNSENVAEELVKIEKVAHPNFWIDMESGVRTDDWFDIDKARKVSEKVKAYNEHKS